MTNIPAPQRQREVRELAADLARLSANREFSEMTWRSIAAQARSIERRAAEMYKRIERDGEYSGA